MDLSQGHHPHNPKGVRRWKNWTPKFFPAKLPATRPNSPVLGFGLGTDDQSAALEQRVSARQKCEDGTPRPDMTAMARPILASVDGTDAPAKPQADANG